MVAKGNKYFNNCGKNDEMEETNVNSRGSEAPELTES